MLGGGGHALVVAEAARLAGFDIAGLFDDSPEPAAVRLMGFRRLGGLGAAAAWRETPMVLVIGDLGVRRKVLAGGIPGLAQAPCIVHPSAVVHGSARLGPGVYVGPTAVVHSFAATGAHAIINTAAVVEHECEIGENAHLCPGSVLGGRVKIGPDTLVGLGSRVLPNLSVGAGATVGGGALVHRDVPAGVTVVGVPARAR